MTVWVPFRMHLNSTTPVSQAEQQRRKLGALLVGGNLLLGAVLAGLVLSVMSSSRQAHEDRARAAAERFVAIASASLQSELGAVDTALKITMDDLQRAGFDAGASVQDINDHLAAKHRVLAGVEGFRVADENGLVRWGNLIDSASPPDITNRDFFFRARDSSSDKAVVSDPVISRVSGHSVIVVARPMAWGGKFRGVLYASIHTEHFEQIFKRYELADHDGISLRTNDLKLVALQSPRGRSAAAVGTRDVAQELQDSLRSKPSAGSYLATSKVDGISRTFAYRQVDGWPLLAIAGLDNSNRWSQWRREMLMVSLLAGLAWALSCAATIAVYRFGRREIRAVAALQAQSRQTQTLLRVAGDGIHILDRAGRLVELSDSFAEMHGSSRDKLQGQHVASWDANQNEARIDAWLAKIRDGDRQRVEVQHVRSDGSIIDVDLHWRAVDIDGHLLIFGSARDITDKKRLLQSLEESSARIQDLYDHAPCGYFSLDADGRFVHLNATAKAWLGGDLPSDAKFVGLLDAATRPQFRDHFIALALQLHAPEIEVCISPANAPQRHLCINSTAVRDADGNFLMSRTVAVDITAQREAQQRVESLLREQSAMLNSDVVGMVKFHHGKVSWKNRAFEKMLGYEDGELAGAAIETLCAEDGERHALAQKTLLAMRRGENYRDDVRLKQKQGTTIWVDLNGVQLSGTESFWMAVDITEAKRAHEQITHVAFHDALTQLPNRLLLLDRMQQALAGAERFGHEVAVCFLDLDGFKEVNDQYGHEAGDKLLVAIAARISACIRATDTAARLGGDEFVLLLAPLAGDEWRVIVDRLMQTVDAPVPLAAGLKVTLGMSIGVALSRGRTQAEVLVAEADEAMLHAKRRGKGRIHLAGSAQFVTRP